MLCVVQRSDFRRCLPLQLFVFNLGQILYTRRQKKVLLQRAHVHVHTLYINSWVLSFEFLLATDLFLAASWLMLGVVHGSHLG